MNPSNSKRPTEYKKYQQASFICASCQKKQSCRKDNLHAGKVCRKCKSRVQLSARGENHPAFHKKKNINQYGFDKDGLHWKGSRHNKGQRRLCLERDKYQCQTPGCKSDDLQVHHLIPFKKCQSHHLSNLTTLCRSHHTEVERFIDTVGAYPYVWPLLDFNPDDPWVWPLTIDTEIPPF